MSAPRPTSSLPGIARDAQTWEMRLYVAGETGCSMTAFANLKRVCEEHLPGRYRIDVIDLREHPHLADEDGILAMPTLVCRLPPPVRRIIGDLSDTGRVLVGLNLARATEDASRKSP